MVSAYLFALVSMFLLWDSNNQVLLLIVAGLTALLFIVSVTFNFVIKNSIKNNPEHGRMTPKMLLRADPVVSFWSNASIFAISALTLVSIYSFFVIFWGTLA
jgi:hypothetical protein